MGRDGGISRVSKTAGDRPANGAIQSDTWYSPEARAFVKMEITKNVPAGVSHYAYELTASKINKEATAAQK
jgi:hypothetical protein